MQWTDVGTLLSVKRHGESAALIEVFTRDHGRHAGLVRGGTSRKMTPHLQPGTRLALSWTARLEEHLGTFHVEPLKSRAAQVLGDGTALAGLNALTALARFALAERVPYTTLWDQTETVFDMIGTSEIWPFAYLRWEQALLDEMGFGMDLTSCAVTGAREGLTFVSPKTGRAVTDAGAGTYKDRLLPLPPPLLGVPPKNTEEVLTGLRTTGWFLETRLATSLGDTPVPTARERLLERLAHSG